MRCKRQQMAQRATAGPRHQWAATRRQQPVNTTQLALSWKRQCSTIAQHQWPSGGHAAAGAGDWTGLGIHIYQQAPAAKAAALQRHCSSWRQPTDMAEAAGNETGATQPEGLCVEQRLRGKGGFTGLLGSLGPHPWLFEAAGQQNHLPRRSATGVAGTGVLGSPTLAVWRSALTGQSPC